MSSSGIAPSTRIHLQNQIILPARNLRVNDKVLSAKDSEIALKQKSQQYMFRIQLENGDYYDVASNQRIVLTNKDASHKFFMTVEDCLKIPRHIFSQYRVLKGRVDWSKNQVEINSFFLGCWLGSRMCDNSGFKTSLRKCKVAQNWFRLFNLNFSVTQLLNYIEYNGFNNKLKQYNLSYNNKFIPRAYKFNDVDTRLSLLRGFILTSECFSRGKTIILRYHNLALAYDFIYLARSLGFKAHVKRNRIVFNNIPSLSYRFSIVPLGFGECVSLNCSKYNDIVLTEDFDEILL